MIATTPTPPTISATLDSAIITMKKPAVILLNASSTRSWVTMAKLFGSPGLEAARAPHRGGDLVLGLERRGRVGRHHGDLHPAALVVGHLDEDGVRDGQPRLVGVAEERRRLGVEADHLERLAEDLDRLADRVAAGKERLRPACR